METLTLTEEWEVTIQTVSEQKVALADYIAEQQRLMEYIDSDIAIAQARKQAILDKLEQLIVE